MKFFKRTPRWTARWRAVLLAAALGGLATSAAAGAGDGAISLRQRHAALQEQLRHNQFQRPLHLTSTQTSGNLRGDVFAVIDHPFSTVGPALQTRENWCEVLILHLNVKLCAPGKADKISVHVGKKFDQPLADAHRIDFDYRLASGSADYLQVELNAAEGPLGTRDYRILVEAVPLDTRRSFIHMSYSYGYGMAARLAMQGYLATVGSDKVGFSVVDRKPDGQVEHVGSVRGVVERNTMRYYLAIEAYLGSRQAPPAQQLTKRLHDWFAATERYPLQLREVDEAHYIRMKLKEVQRQQRS